MSDLVIKQQKLNINGKTEEKKLKIKKLLTLLQLMIIKMLIFFLKLESVEYCLDEHPNCIAETLSIVLGSK